MILTITGLSWENHWIFIGEEDGISSYRLPGNASTPDRYRAITTLNCRLDIIAVILEDFPNYTRWMPDCIELKPLEFIDENRMLLYYHHHTPWPFRNRDAVLRVTTNLDTLEKTLFIHSILVDDERYPPMDNPVRMEEMEAHWTIQYIDDAHTKIIYQLSSDPGGLIPEGQIRRFTEDLPAETVIGLSKMITLAEYIEKAKSSAERKIVDQF